MEIYDLIIIGAGPGGYTAALKAASMGLKTVIIEKNLIGGACVNFGCIPTKALLQATSVYSNIKNASHFGIDAPIVSFNFKQMQSYKRKSVIDFRAEIISKLMNKNVELVQGVGRLHKNNIVEVTDDDGTYEICGNNIIISTGAKPVIPKIPGVDLPQVLISREILKASKWDFDELVIIGGGVIGVEIATVFAELGSKVKIIEMSDRLLGNLDVQIGEQLKLNLESKGIEIILNAEVKAFRERSNDSVLIDYEKDGEICEISADRVLLAIGRRPDMSEVLADDCEVELVNNIPKVKSSFMTTQKGVYAIGDIVSPLRLAHVAASQGTYVVENIIGKGHSMQLNVVPNGMFVVLPVVPSCIYTDPEIASVGLSAAECEKYGMKVKIGNAYMKGNGKALLARKENGFVSLIFESYTSTLVGAHIMCPRATDMIGEMATAIANGLTAYQLATAMRAHPTYSEVIADAIEDALS